LKTPPPSVDEISAFTSTGRTAAPAAGAAATFLESVMAYLTIAAIA
jgi:hypothetical protein